MRILVPALSAIALLLAPASASAIIQVDRGMAGARINNTKAEVRAALGQPRRVIKGMNDFGRFTEFRYRGQIRVIFQGRKRVSSVSTTGLGDRTRRGVGVGSTEAEVQDRVAGITCETFGGTFRSCHTGDFSAGSRVTDFQIDDGVVTRVVVGIVID